MLFVIYALTDLQALALIALQVAVAVLVFVQTVVAGVVAGQDLVLVVFVLLFHLVAVSVETVLVAEFLVDVGLHKIKIMMQVDKTFVLEIDKGFTAGFFALKFNFCCKIRNFF